MSRRLPSLDRERLTRALIVAVYLLPAVTALITLLLFARPRFYFLYLGIEHEPMSLFTLLKNTWESCQVTLRADNALYEYFMFSRTMIAYSIAFWTLLVAYLFFAFYSATCACVALSNKPTSTLSNHAKKLFVFACFNRPVYIIFQIMPIILALFPRVLLSQYHSKLGMLMTLSYHGLSTPLILFFLVSLSSLAFLLSLSSQRSLHLDMFRFYKRRGD